MIQHSVHHTSFVIERELSASPARVFRAWSDPEAQQRWSDCHSDAEESERSLDFRPGGREWHRVVRRDGIVQAIEKVFFDIVPDRRIIFAYDILVGQQRLSASLVTVTFEPSSKGTRMIYTEQLALLDGFEDLDGRIQGTKEGLDRLELEFRIM